ncbi:MAG: TolC family protein [Pseudobdellovibrionaceae bacterium]
MRYAWLIALFFLCGGPFWCFANSPELNELGLLDVFSRASKISPSLRLDEDLQKAAKEEIRIKESRYYPHLNVAAVASTGNPGAFSLMDVDSDLSSTNRVGVGGALILKQIIWDFGRTSQAVRSARLEMELTKMQAALSKMNVYQDILNTYLECAFLKTQIENSQLVAQKVKILAEETDKFVRSGQRSIIERYLVDSEEKADETRVAEFSERLKATEQRLNLLLSRPQVEVHCHKLSEVEGDIAYMDSHSPASPLLEIQKLKIEAAESHVSEARSDQYPEIFGMATAGVFDNEHLKNRTNYAAGVGISLPLFSGFAIDSRIDKQVAVLNSERTSLEAFQQMVDKVNSRYDEKINSFVVRLQFLNEEKRHAKIFFDLAQKRYKSLKGTMVDLRDSIKNMNRIILLTDETNRDLFLARGEKNVFNGF